MISAGGLDGLHDFAITGASTEDTGDGPPDFSLCRLRVVIQQVLGSEKHSRRAESALNSAFLNKAALERMQFALLFKPFHRDNRSPFRLHHGNKA